MYVLNIGEINMYSNKIKEFITLALLCFSTANLYALENDEAKFMAKDKENILKITNYQKEKEDELERLKRKREQQELLKKIKEEEERVKNLDKQAEIEKELERQRLLEERRLQEKKEQEEREQAERNRKSKVKLVVMPSRDVIEFNKKPEGIVMENYDELGIQHDTASSNVLRSNLITPDQYIRLLTETNINSRRGGEYVAVVESNVYSLDAQVVLIPKGTKFICNFEPLTRYGETALVSECTRAILPSGASVFISGGTVSDQMHRAGISGEVDNRTWEKYGQTFTMAILGGVAMLGASKIPSDDVGSLAQYTALNIVNMATEVLDKQVDLAPVVIIPSATRIILKPKVDINFTSKKSTKKSKESK